MYGVLVTLVCCTGSVHADLMAVWDFGPSSAYYTTAATAENVVGTPTLILGGGELDVNGKNGVAFTDAAGVVHGAGQAGAWEDVKVTGTDAYWILTIDTTGWQDMAIRWDYKAWDALTNSFDLDYNLDGSTWITILNNAAITGDEAFHSISCDLSAIAGINNHASVQFKMYDLDENGNDKFAFDNLQITGTAIPEPATALLLLAGAGILRKRRIF
jgi:hypothetical protein